ncbi:hypothetical protein MLD38_022881 [Melastoma candidum]|uniref:Uncharacterized protein n=1 Tax=Melastoma candidum TaxID=119954 RepID=A0ACB9QKY3_9MYRT|nr:hypothetical protein MLD38_022881 [Melastoma candidum]
MSSIVVSPKVVYWLRIMLIHLAMVRLLVRILVPEDSTDEDLDKLRILNVFTEKWEEFGPGPGSLSSNGRCYGVPFSLLSMLCCNNVRAFANSF